MSTLYIKNMVCDRCKMAVSQTLQQVGLYPQKVELGEVSIEEDPSSSQLSTLRAALKELGFELLDDRRQQTIDHIKSALIRLVHYHDNQSSTNLSDYLSSELVKTIVHFQNSSQKLRERLSKDIISSYV